MKICMTGRQHKSSYRGIRESKRVAGRRKTEGMPKRRCDTRRARSMASCYAHVTYMRGGHRRGELQRNRSSSDNIGAPVNMSLT